MPGTQRPLTNEDLLGRWIDGSLTAPEEAELERRAQNDAGLAAALAGLQQRPDHDHAAALTGMLANATRRAPRPVPATVSRRRRLLPRFAAAAAVLLLLSTLALLLPRYLVDAETPIVSDVATDAAATEATPPVPPPTAEPEDLAAAEIPPADTESPPPPSTLPTSPEATATPAPATAQKNSARVTAPLARQSANTAVERDGMRYEESRRPPPTPPLTGTVTDEDGQPVDGATLRRPGQALGQRTDSSGGFLIPVDPTLDRLIIERDGYESEEVEVTADDQVLSITLTEEMVDDSPFETGARTRLSREDLGLEPPNGARAQPREGYRNLRRRIEDNRPSDVPKGRIRLSFLVAQDGSLGDFRFRGRPDSTTMNYVGNILVETSDWTIVSGEAPVRVYLKLRFE